MGGWIVDGILGSLTLDRAYMHPHTHATRAPTLRFVIPAHPIPHSALDPTVSEPLLVRHRMVPVSISWEVLQLRSRLQQYPGNAVLYASRLIHLILP